MTAGDYLAALAALPSGTLHDLVGPDPFLVLSPHPDDETLGCGGLLAAAAGEGLAPSILILTDGAASHRGSPSYPPDRLSALRRDEARQAVACLGLPPDRLHFLDLRDAATPRSGPDFEAAVDAIAALAQRMKAGTLFVTWGRDPHCDHETAFAMAKAVAARIGIRLWAYPVWALHLPRDAELDETPPSGFRVAIAPGARAAKRRALACYASQMTRLIDDDPDGFCFSDEQLAPFLGDTETFIAVSP